MKGRGRPSKVKKGSFQKLCSFPVGAEELSKLAKVLGYDNANEMVYLVFLKLVNENLKDNE